MAAIYYRLIKENVLSINNVPDRDRAAVQALIDASGEEGPGDEPIATP